MIALIRKTTAAAGLLVLALGFGLANTAFAHEGHSHTVMGVVWKVTSERLEVKTKDGKTETIVITDKTAISRGKTATDLSDVVPGARVVVDVGTGKKPLTARAIKVGVVEPKKTS